MACTKLINNCNINCPQCKFFKDKLHTKKQDHFFSEMLFEKDCAMSSLDYLIYEDTKLDESKENEKIKQISETIFLVSTRSDYLELNWEKDSTNI